MGQALFGKQGWDWGRGGTGRAGPQLPLLFSNDSQAVMLEGASGIDHLLQQAYFTSAISETGLGEGPRAVSVWGGGRGIHHSCPLMSTPRATCAPQGPTCALIYLDPDAGKD